MSHFNSPWRIWQLSEKKHDYHKRKHASFLKPTPKQKQDRLSVAGGRSFTMPYIPKTAYLRCFLIKKEER